ncbi:MAG: hypothetical protein WC729_28200 [Sphingomonas sp.]|jgi:hypothetical protein|uniref:hypothetical protein n=1 Tax=Sphingomonas sp. TaxID=28214 RepID=UPI00356696B2
MAIPPPISPTDPVVVPGEPETPRWQAPVEEPVPDDPEVRSPPPDRDFPEQTPGEMPAPEA